MGNRAISNENWNGVNRNNGQLSDFDNIVRKAKYSHTADNVDHNKFSKFRYYKCKVKYKGEENEIWLNVGYHKELKDWHIYAITTIK